MRVFSCRKLSGDNAISFSAARSVMASSAIRIVVGEMVSDRMCRNRAGSHEFSQIVTTG